MTYGVMGDHGGHNHPIHNIPMIFNGPGVGSKDSKMGPARVRALRSPVAAFVYLLRCSDGTLYCGWSTDPARRWRQHQTGSASRYTRARRPVELVWTLECSGRSEAMRLEARIKRLPAAAKRELVASTAAPTSSTIGASPTRTVTRP